MLVGLVFSPPPNPCQLVRHHRGVFAITYHAIRESQCVPPPRGWDLASIANLGEITKILSAIWKAKGVLRETVEIIKVYLDRNYGDDSDPEGRQGQRQGGHSAQDFL